MNLRVSLAKRDPFDGGSRLNIGKLGFPDDFRMKQVLVSTNREINFDPNYDGHPGRAANKFTGHQVQ